MATVTRACTLCEAGCGLTVTLDAAGTITAVEGDLADPMSQGYLCPKGVAIQDVLTDPDRLRRPVVRQPDGSFVEVAWDHAFDLVGKRLRSIRRAHGNDAVATYIGNPAGHSMAAFQIGILVDALRTTNQYSAATTDQAPQSLVSWLLFGNQYLFPVPDIDRTDHLLIVGANPIISNGSLVQAPDWRRRIGAIRDRGGHVVVVDPRRTETARVAGNHVAVRPGTDALLLAAILAVIDAEGLVTPGRASDWTDGIPALLDAVRHVTPELAAPVVGVAPERIRELARAFATAPRAAAYSRIGPCQTRHGSVVAWLVIALNVVTGNLDEPGGSMFTRPAFDLQRMVGISGRTGSWKTRHSRVRGLAEFGGEFPAATLADEILATGDGQVRALVIFGGNPVLSFPNGGRMDEAMRELDFGVAVDFHINESTRHCDVILPPIASTEREHYDLIFHTWAVRNVARLSPALAAPDPNGRTEQDILMEVATRVGVGPTERVALWLLGRARGLLDPLRILDIGLRLGPWGLRRGRAGLSVAKLRAAGRTMDLGPLARELPARLFTSDKRLALAPPPLLDALALAVAELTAADTAPAADELLLLGRRRLRQKNSYLHNSQRLVKGRDRCTILLHPDDADSRGIADGDPVVVTSRVGKVELPAQVSDEMAIGVASIPHGWGHGRPGSVQQVADTHPGVSVNDLTDDHQLEVLTGNAAFNDLRVTVQRA